MQVFDIRFNHKAEEDRFFDFFALEPQNIYEKRLGSLYISGDLLNALPQNSRLIDNTSQVIRKKYYNFSFKSQEKALSESLKKVNDFLGDEIKKDNVDWLGNFNFSILSIRDFNLTFSAAGKIKIILMRGGEITDIGEGLNSQEIEPYPLKVFFNIISGKLIEGDRVAVISHDIYDILFKKNILARIAKAKEIDKRIIKRFVSPSNIFEEIKSGSHKASIQSGLFSILCIDGKSSSRLEKIFMSQEEAKFSIFSLLSTTPSKLNRIKRKAIKLFKKKKDGDSISIIDNIKNNVEAGANLISVIKEKSGSSFSVGRYAKFFKLPKFPRRVSIISESEESSHKVSIKVKEDKNGIFSKINLNFSSLYFKIGSGILMVSAIVVLSVFLWPKKIVNKPAINITSGEEIPKIEEKNVEFVEPEFLFSFDSQKIGFEPKNIIFSNSSFYLWAPNSKKVFNFIIDEGKEKTLEADSPIKLAAPFSNSAIFFSDPNFIYLPMGSKFSKDMVSLINPLDRYDLISTYSSNLYFVNNSNSQIIKYPYISKYLWGSPKVWLKSDSQINAKSLLAEDNLWLLSSNNQIHKYYKGELKETLTLDISADSNLTSIKTNLDTPYLYLLDSKNNKIIIADKFGKVIKQLKSKTTDPIFFDIEISKDGKLIWLLSASTVSELPFNF